MKQKLIDKLTKRFKFMKPGKDDKGMYPYNMFSIECADGWFDLLRKLCEGIEKALNKGEDIFITQVKEKFSGLRFYYSGGNDLIDKLVEKAENDSFKICEGCGKKGKLRKLNGWLSTLCIKCFKKWKKEQDKRFGVKSQ
jgi:hypothetical protein